MDAMAQVMHQMTGTGLSPEAQVGFQTLRRFREAQTCFFTMCDQQ